MHRCKSKALFVLTAHDLRQIVLVHLPRVKVHLILQIRILWAQNFCHSKAYTRFHCWEHHWQLLNPEAVCNRSRWSIFYGKTKNQIGRDKTKRFLIWILTLFFESILSAWKTIPPQRGQVSLFCGSPRIDVVLVVRLGRSYMPASLKNVTFRFISETGCPNKFQNHKKDEKFVKM